MKCDTMLETKGQIYDFISMRYLEETDSLTESRIVLTGGSEVGRKGPCCLIGIELQLGMEKSSGTGEWW